jgi:UDP-2,3-diacylglucosamine pyrophosphatase LpxH
MDPKKYRCEHRHDGLSHPRCFEVDNGLKLPTYEGRGRIQTKGDAIIAFDLHSPYHDPEMIKLLFKLRKKRKIDTLIIGGDTTDFKSLYHKEGQDAEYSWTEEMRLTKRLMRRICSEFKYVYWIKGNHDHRLARLLNSNKQMMDLYTMILDFPNLTMLDTFYCEVNGWLLINHPMRARRNKVSYIEDLCRRYRKSVLNGHTHRFVFAVDDSGNDVIGEGLHLTNPDYHEYKTRELGLHSEWVQGVWIMHGESIFPYVIHPRVYNNEA